MDKAERGRLVFAAERLERATKRPGAPSGVLGLTGLAVLRVLCFRFGGAPAPSYKDLKRATGHCVETVRQAVKRLAAAGVIAVEARRRKTAAGSRVISNRYWLLSLILGARSPVLPSESKLEKAKPVPFDQLTGPLKEALEALGRRIGEGEGESP